MVDGVSSLSTNGANELFFNLAEEADGRRINCEELLMFATGCCWCVSWYEDR